MYKTEIMKKKVLSKVKELQESKNKQNNKVFYQVRFDTYLKREEASSIEGIKKENLGVKRKKGRHIMDDLWSKIV